MRAFPGGRNQESRRGAFGFNNTEVERRAGSGSAGFRSRSGGGNAFGSRVGSRLEDYGMRPGSSPGADKGSPGPRPGDDYVGPAAQILGASNTIITSTLLGSGIAGVTAATQVCNGVSKQRAVVFDHAARLISMRLAAHVRNVML